jgi:hypothetical protein
MLNPKEQQKGGFGAFAEREHERRAARAAAAVTEESPVIPAAAAPVPLPGRAEKTTDRAPTSGG